MATRDPRKTTNLDGYDASTIPWEKVRNRLDAGVTDVPESGGPNRHTHWLATVGPAGAPHVMPIGAVWIDGSYYFTSGPGTKKSKNLAADPRCVLTVATEPFDIVSEGRAQRVTDANELERLAAVYRDGGWPARVEADAFTAEFSAPSAGPPPWHLYRVDPTTTYALGTAEPYGATRYRF